MKCEDCGKEIKLTELQGLSIEEFKEIGHSPDEMCSKCFKSHLKSIRKYKQDNKKPWQTSK